MNKLIFILTTFFLSMTWADIGIDCLRKDGSQINVYDTREGYFLRDTGRYPLQKGMNITRFKEAPDKLILPVDNGTSVRIVYAFSGLKECETEGANDKVLLVIKNQFLESQTKTIEKLSCQCFSD